jgi:hypothetical protein
MSDQNAKPPQVIINALMASGFPFQTAVARVVQHVPQCDLVAEEFPWRDEISGEQFLDLVAQKGPFIVAIECKKTQKEILTFLQPEDNDDDVIRARCVYLTQILDSTKRLELYCSDWRLRPKSAESMFCVVSTSESGKDQRMLERDAHLIVRGTDAYARYYIRHFKTKQVPIPDTLIVSLIVTNAKIFVATYNPANLDLETGQFPVPLPAAVSPVPWVRFRKAFTSGSGDMGDRTVFIVRATELATWLSKLDMTQTTPEGVKSQIQWR